MVGYTPGGTAPPLRPSPCRPPGVIHMNLPKKEELATHGPWVSNQACLLEDLLHRQRKDLKRSWVLPNRQQRKGFYWLPSCGWTVLLIVIDRKGWNGADMQCE